MEKACILTIAGSDSCGGAGIQADVKTAAAFGVHAATALTCVTAQNTAEFIAIQPLDEEMIRAQVRTAARDLPLAAVKVGMLGSVRTVEAVVQLLTELRDQTPDLPIILDPVLAATTGGSMDSERIGRAIARDLLPLVTVLTPNLPEAMKLAEFCRLVLARRSPDGEMPPEPPQHGNDKAHSNWAARILIAAGCRSVLVKGGHTKDPDQCVDLLYLYNGDPLGSVERPPADDLEENEPAIFTRFMVPTLDATLCVPVSFTSPRREGEFHGTGCVLSTAIACGLTGEMTIPDAVYAARNYLQSCMDEAGGMGSGSFILGA